MFTTKKQRITIAILLVFTLVFTLIPSTKAFASTTTQEKTDSYTLTYIENELCKYLETKNIEPDTEEYVNYLVDMLNTEHDSELKKHPLYKEIRIYASEYLSDADSLSKSFEPNKSIDDVIAEAKKQSIEDSKINNVDEITPLATSSYSTSKAVAYAKEYAKYRNPVYNTYLKDCTNFVSQCLVAGGKTMKKPSSIPLGLKTTTSYWYSVRYKHEHATYWEYKWKESTSFVNVGDLYTYCKNNGATIKTYTSLSSLQNNAKLGDIVQLKSSEGNWYHSIIITGGSAGDRSYCSHTRDRSDRDVSTLTGVSSFRIIRF